MPYLSNKNEQKKTFAELALMVKLIILALLAE
jgi:hypothetical protein